MLAIVGTIPAEGFPIISGKITLDDSHIRIGDGQDRQVLIRYRDQDCVIGRNVATVAHEACVENWGWIDQPEGQAD